MSRFICNGRVAAWFRTTLVLLLGGGVVLVATWASAQEEENPDFGKTAALKTATAAEARQKLEACLKDELKVDDKVQEQALAAFDQAGEATAGPELVDRLLDALALVRPEAKELISLCEQPNQHLVLPEFAWLIDDAQPRFLRDHARLMYGRWLSREKLYEESLEILNGLEPEAVVDPSGLLFYQSVAYHRLLQKEPGLKAIRRLLDEVQDGPQRYTSLAALMFEDLKSLKDDSLDHIARRMEDITRRMDLGRTGPKVRKVEDGVVASLDKLIEEMEKQQQQQQQSSSGSSGGSQSTQPAPDSRIMGGKGPGDIDRKNIGSRSGWGDLPPKQREEALQQIGKDFPSHYREIIEQYFRRLASEERAP